jgi:hypothetical protein
MSVKFKCRLDRGARVYVALTALCLCMASHANVLVVSHAPLVDANDVRFKYPLELIKAALEKTQSQYGSYRIDVVGAPLTFARSLHELKRNAYENFFILSGENAEGMNDKALVSIDFPIDHGLLGYRICFVSPNAKESVKKVKTLDDLRKFSLLQGTGWPDVAILKHNGFHVEQASIYSGLFKMIISNRADLFCRGIQELKNEYAIYGKIGSLYYDESIALVYIMPWKFFFNKQSALAKKRIEEGLKIAFNDGTVKKLYLQYHADSIRFAALKKRKLFFLQNPSVTQYSETYKSFLIDPLTVE